MAYGGTMGGTIRKCSLKIPPGYIVGHATMRDIARNDVACVLQVSTKT